MSGRTSGGGSLEAVCSNRPDRCSLARNKVPQRKPRAGWKCDECGWPPVVPRSSSLPVKWIAAGVAAAVIAAGGVVAVRALFKGPPPVALACPTGAPPADTPADKRLAMARLCIDGGHLDVATRLLDELRQQGNPAAALELAKLYDPRELTPGRAKQVAANKAVAVELYRQAAAGGIAEATAALAALADIKGPARTVQTGRQPLPLPQAADVPQRILTTTPGLKLASAPDGAPTGDATPIFSIFYVYGRQGDWLEVGRDVRRGPEGWLRTTSTLPWSIMLTMKYADPGQRRRVMFFAKPDDIRAIAMANNPVPLLDRLERSADAGQPTDPAVVSIEPATPRGLQPAPSYLMPIVDFRADDSDRFPGGEPITLLKVALVNSTPREPPTQPGQPATPASLANVSGALVFVLDTTVSMKPYFERSVQAIERILNVLRSEKLDGKVSVGVVAYRNNIDSEPYRSRLEYVDKVIQPLDPHASLEQISARLKDLDEAKGSSHSFNEDAIAGLWTSLKGLDWTPFQGKPKLVLLVTDAGALSGHDPKAKYKGIELETVRETARHDDIVLFPLHIASPGAKQAGNVAPTRQQYLKLSYTGDENVLKYRQLPGGAAEFDRYMTDVEKTLETVFQSWAANQPIERQPVKNESNTAEGYGNVIINELFNYQQKLIGVQKNARTEPVQAAWAIDRDLSAPEETALDVSVYLTKMQLNQLAQSARRLLQGASSQAISADALFRYFQGLSASTAVDPERYRGDAETIAQTGVLPSYLKLLPYHSKFLNLNAKDWANMTGDQQTALRIELESKLRAWDDIDHSAKDWTDYGVKDEDQKVYPMPLELLP